MKLATILTMSIVLALAASATAQPRDAAADTVADKHIAGLIGQLGDPQFAVRQRAQQQLLKLGFEAFDALLEAEDNDDPEVAMQAGYLVRQIRSQWTHDTDPRPIRQILDDYEVQNDERRLAKIKQLAALPDDQGLKWLCRLVRFERSPVLSKQAALAIIEREPSDEVAWNRRSETIRAELVRARRPAVRWLEAYLQAHSDPAGALPAWTEIAAAERQTLEQHPQDTRSQIVLALLRSQVELLDRLGRNDETPDVMRQMVLSERGDSASLTEMIDWLVDRKSWDMIDLVAERFAASFDVDAVLMYTLCEARMAQGDRELAEKTAERASKISGDSQEDHAQLAQRLTDRGLPRWADREWRQVIELGPMGTNWDIYARTVLANSLHDRQLDQEAASLLDQLLDAADKQPDVSRRIRIAGQQIAADVSMLRANMYYYLSCHADAQSDAAGRRELLEKALEQDETNVEVLIGLYQATADDPQARAKLIELIDKTIETCRSEIEGAPEVPTFYNEIAWLVANTEGDFDEAVELSQKSIELAQASGDSPHRLGGLLDTLAHCCYAKKDFANAVKHQEEAIKLDPHTQSIRRALDRFREAAAKSQTPDA